MDEIGLIRSPRAQRFFRPEPVSAADIEAIIEVARRTGSARNRQPWRFVCVTDPARRRELAALGQYAQVLAGAPAVLLLLSDPDAGRDTEFDLGRVCQSILLAAHARDLGSCPVSLYPHEHAVTAARLAGSPWPWPAHHAVALGRPAETPAGRSAIPAGRKAVSELLWHADG
ncbi:nitroreductase family protein [Saccharomonospora sp. NPDC046836]|uniref:nitroreductase family protein n=1 Tax=Saccharomonospora sp. NPDC046836 TaxID=3156921 RepID=UPI0033D74DBE